ncbi:hypothetical protein QJQ45_022854 [Haematococcus lacustris]|nr:hypothetical protein QJQ45_022854 [Haematococcus lacustris]
MAAPAGRTLRRYHLVKLFAACESAMVALSATRDPKQLSNGFQSAVDGFRKSWTSKLTSELFFTGPSMCPTINSGALSEPGSVSRLIIRNIPVPTSRSVQVGDVIAFSSPLALPSPSSDASTVLVRRVAAMEGDELVAVQGSGSGDMGDEEEEVLEVPKGHCWVLADNEQLKPTEVLDSRSMGYIPLCNVIGRVIYAGSSSSDHGPVVNNPASMEEDQAVIKAEVDVDSLYDA